MRVSGFCVEAKVGPTVVRLCGGVVAANEDVVVGDSVVDDACDSFVEFCGAAVATVVGLEFCAVVDAFASVVATVVAFDCVCVLTSVLLLAPVDIGRDVDEVGMSVVCACVAVAASVCVVVCNALSWLHVNMSAAHRQPSTLSQSFLSKSRSHGIPSAVL
jgi:hypothetical protein